MFRNVFAGRACSPAWMMRYGRSRSVREGDRWQLQCTPEGPAPAPTRSRADSPRAGRPGSCARTGSRQSPSRMKVGPAAGKRRPGVSTTWRGSPEEPYIQGLSAGSSRVRNLHRFSAVYLPVTRSCSSWSTSLRVGKAAEPAPQSVPAWFCRLTFPTTSTPVSPGRKRRSRLSICSRFSPSRHRSPMRKRNTGL